MVVLPWANVPTLAAHCHQNFITGKLINITFLICNFLFINIQNSSLYSDVEAYPEDTTETIDASGANCASNLQLHNDDKFLDDF